MFIKPTQVVVTQQEIYRAETEKIEERALSVADSTKSVTKQITTESSGDYSVPLQQPEDDTDVTVHAVELKELSAGIAASVKVVPVPDLSEANVPTPHRSEAVQAMLIDVSGVEEAIDHINKYGSSHTDSIVTKNKKTAKKFLSNINSSIAIHNASTQFADGGEFGFGAEVGISTSKLHPRGPIGINQLTTYKYILEGKGQVRK